MTTKNPLGASQSDQTLLLGTRELESPSFRFFFHDWVPIASIILLVQISLCLFAWIFAGFMMHRTIALPDSIADWIQNHSNDTQTILTLFSTILALTSSFLLGAAVQYALIRCLLNAPLRLHTMVELSKLAQRSISLSFNRRRLSWTLLSVSWIGLLSFLTTAWASLLAPRTVVIYYKLQGNETNLLSASKLPGNIGPWNYRPSPGYDLTPSDIIYITTPSQGFDFVEALMDAGSCATSAKVLDNFAATNFISLYASAYISNISTGGIYPTGNIATPPSSLYPGINQPYQGLSRTYNVTQHGFTADISCRTPTSNDPAITLQLTESTQISVKDSYWTLKTYSWSTNCSSGIGYSTQGVAVIENISSRSMPNGLLMTSVCFAQSFTGSSNRSFLVLFDAPQNSSYSAMGPQICEVTPLVTTVQASYDQTGIINVVQLLHNQSLPDPTSDAPTQISSFYLTFVTWGTFVGSQGPMANMMGDKLVALHQAGGNSSGYSFELENFLQGMMEYIGSFVSMAVDKNPTQSGNSSSTAQFYGTVNAVTFGWTFHLRTHCPALSAITLVTVLTLVAGAFAMIPVDHCRDKGTSVNMKQRAATAQWFDPTATMDVLLASSAGDLARVLSGSGSHVSGQEGDHEEGLRIVLGMTDKGRPALRTVSGQW